MKICKFQVNCGRRRDALFKRRFRARFARAGGVSPEINDTIPESGLVEEFIDEDLSWLKNIAVGNSSKLAFSSVVLVNEDEEEQLAQRQLERWLAQGKNYNFYVCIFRLAMLKMEKSSFPENFKR